MHRNRFTRLPKLIQTSPIFCEIGRFDVEDRVKQRDSFREHGSNVLAAFPCYFLQAGVGIGIDFKGASNDVHGGKILAVKGNVERRNYKAFCRVWLSDLVSGDISGQASLTY